MENSNSKICSHIEDSLADYADEQLSASESSKIAQHLKACSDCRIKVEALRKSLAVTQIIWADSLSQIDDIPLPGPKRTKSGWIWPTAVAATVLFAAGLLLIVFTQITRVDPITQFPTAAQIDREINRVDIAAKLLAAADLLTKHPDAENALHHQYRHIIEIYPDTPAADVTTKLGMV